MLEKQKAHLQLKKHNYFNFAESKSEAEEWASIRVVSSREEAGKDGPSPTSITAAAKAGSSSGEPRLRTSFPPSRTSEGSTSRTTKKRTSYTEYEVDALALKTEEGRGDRRNVQGELHTSHEP